MKIGKQPARVVGPVVSAVALTLVSTASTHVDAPMWTVAKADRVVARDATVRMPANERAALRAELLELIPRFRILENTAWDVSDDQAAGRAHSYRYRYSTALKLVEGGLPVADAICRGAGRRRQAASRTSRAPRSPSDS